MKRDKIHFCKLCISIDNKKYIRPAEGYRFDFDNLHYAISKVDNFWTAVELTSGIAVGIYTKLLRDIPEAFQAWKDSGKLQSIEKMILSNENKEILEAQELVKTYLENALRTRSASNNA